MAVVNARDLEPLCHGFKYCKHKGLLIEFIEVKTEENEDKPEKIINFG